MRGEIVATVLVGSLLGAALASLGSCVREERSTGIGPARDDLHDAAPIRESPADPAGAAIDAGAFDAAAPSASDAAIPGGSTLVIPPLDTTCAVDADCGYVAVELSGVTTCCPSCGTTIGSATWASAVRAVCASGPVMLSNPCVPLACPMGPTKARCDAGRCVPKW